MHTIRHLTSKKEEHLISSGKYGSGSVMFWVRFMAVSGAYMKIDSTINSPKHRDNSAKTWLPLSRVSDFTIDVSFHMTVSLRE